MGDLLTTGSVLAAFFAGGVALFAPCCIVFLAPSHMAVAVKNRRWRLLPLTFSFAAGLALVLVPSTLGMSLVASAIANYHQPLYYAGGVLMLALACVQLVGEDDLAAELHPCPRHSTRRLRELLRSGRVLRDRVVVLRHCAGRGDDALGLSGSPFGGIVLGLA